MSNKLLLPHLWGKSIIKTLQRPSILAKVDLYEVWSAYTPIDEEPIFENLEILPPWLVQQACQFT